MKDARKTTEVDAVRRLRAQRAARGLVAGYIHELSDRHAKRRPKPRAGVRRPAEGT